MPSSAGSDGPEIGPDARPAAPAFGADAADSHSFAAAADARAAADGDPEALQRLWTHHRRWIAAIILAHKPREADLEDLLQEVALSLVRNVDKVRDPAAVRPWLRTVAVNAARAAGRTVTRRKKLRPEVRSAALDRAPDTPDPAEIVGDRDHGAAPDAETGGGLLRLAEDLPEAYRVPLLLRVARGMSYREIEAVTGLSETTIETRIARGRRMLREIARKRLQDRNLQKNSVQQATGDGAG